MKVSTKLLLSMLLSCMIISQTEAQITIDKDDIMIPGMNLDEHIDTTTGTVDFGNPGNGQTWDFSNLTYDTIWPSNIEQPGSQVLANKFPTATAVISRFGINVQYYENTNSEAIFLGSVVAIPLFDTLVFNHNYSYITFPATLGDKHSDIGDGFIFFKNPAGFDPDGPGPHPFVDSIATYTIDYFDAHIDAAGVVKTPIHQYESLRQYSKSTTKDSLIMYANGQWQAASQTMATFLMMPLVETDTAYTYAWMVKEGGLPVMTIEFDPDNNDEVLVAQWTNYLPMGINGIAEKNQYSIFPNPTRDFLNIDSNQEFNFKIFSEKGDLVEEGMLIHDGKIDIRDLGRGNYYLQLMDKSGRSESHKFIKLD